MVTFVLMMVMELLVSAVILVMITNQSAQHEPRQQCEDGHNMA